MTGEVDAFGRALLRVTLTHPTTGATLDCDAWVDTVDDADFKALIESRSGSGAARAEKLFLLPPPPR